MKTIFLYTRIILGIFILQSFILISENEVTDYELQPNETIPLKGDPNMKTDQFFGSYSQRSYDLTRYTIKVDTTGTLTVSDLRGCKGKHQNELSLFTCSGTITRMSDSIIIHAKTVYDKLYIFSIKKNGIVDSFSSEIKIELISKTLKNEYCPSLLTTSHGARIVALPKNIKTSEVYKHSHKEKTVGVFTYFSLKDSKGKSKLYTEGDYVLMGGNNAVIKK